MDLFPNLHIHYNVFQNASAFTQSVGLLGGNRGTPARTGYAGFGMKFAYLTYMETAHHVAYKSLYYDSVSFFH